MNSLIVDLVLLGLTYVVLIYFVATLTKARLNHRNNDSRDDGDGGVENYTPPKIDLPPGIVWPKDSIIEKTRDKSPVNY
ncbi:hypothetical protein MM213_11750 [Belliella sp. R4-6]|uniref:Uncharacterized protein n=1 Tax=Belliella alkalica TaxID=1730871 RepID=A0ABS9VDP0_9BACT|nr:hypothetical protein [Belliella alkalica]MCH7414165.1 hypothetical protein [Belliella alkalica]